MADFHPHSTLGSRICNGLPRPISAHHIVCSPFPQTCSPELGSYQVLAHLKIAWFASSHLCPPPCLLTLSPDMFASAWLLSSPCSPQDRLVCLIPSLPTTLFAHPFPRHVCQCLAPIKSSLTSRSLGLPRPISARHLVCSPFPQTFSPVLGSYQVLAHLKIAWFASSHLLLPPHLLTLPTQGSSTWLAGWGVDSWMVWVLIECELLVTSPHQAPHAALLALGVFPPSLFFICVFFLVVFFGGLGGHESWLGLRPPSCHHR